LDRPFLKTESYDWMTDSRHVRGQSRPEHVHPMSSFKSGFISILGKPNVGKSTLLNHLLGEKVAIVSDRPQTTRSRILGIKNTANAQLIFYDTPGIHRPRSRLHDSMVRSALQAGKDVDLILLVTEAPDPQKEQDRSILETLLPNPPPIFLIINKIDLIKRVMLLPLMDQYQKLYRFEEIVPISALHGEGLERLLEAIQNHLPSGPQYFPDDMTTDQTERFLAAEMIRERIFQATYQEIPYSVGVIIEAFQDDAAKGVLSISATIVVNKASQKAILIGKRGQMLKRIGSEARHEMERFFHTQVFLQLWIKVVRNWSDKTSLFKEMGYG
jgi:GTP-binding protein Era